MGNPTRALTITCLLSEEYLLSQNPIQASEGKWKKKLLIQEISTVWAEDNPLGLAKHVPQVVVPLTSGAMPIGVRQYLISSEAREGIKTHIRLLLKEGILIRCQSAWNTSLLLVQKPGTHDYRPVQDLREVNKWVETVHPTVPNPSLP